MFLWFGRHLSYVKMPSEPIGWLTYFYSVFLPINHYASKVVVKAQDNLMKSRDERTSLMNEVTDSSELPTSSMRLILAPSDSRRDSDAQIHGLGTVFRETRLGDSGQGIVVPEDELLHRSIV